MKPCAICNKPVSGGVVVHHECLRKSSWRYFRLVCSDGYKRMIGIRGETTADELVKLLPAIYDEDGSHCVTAAIELDSFDPDWYWNLGEGAAE